MKLEAVDGYGVRGAAVYRVLCRGHFDGRDLNGDGMRCRKHECRDACPGTLSWPVTLSDKLAFHY